MNTVKDFKPSARTTVKRLPERGVYDLGEIHQILDEAFICHVGFTVEGQPYVIPTAYGRVGDTFYLHGSAASRMLRAMGTGIPVCITVTLVDGLVLARSAFHHSINYRSVVLLGEATFVNEPSEKLAALRAITEHIIPGRWDGIRWPNDQELKATSVLALPISEASAKARTGPPLDDDEDYELPIWAGELPLMMMTGSPIEDPRLISGIQVPDCVRDYSRKGRAGDDTAREN